MRARFPVSQIRRPSKIEASCPHRPGASGLTGAALSDAIDAAEAHCARQGRALGETRRRVLELLYRAGRPLKAAPLTRDLSDPAPTSPATVYRALAGLIEMGLAHRVVGADAFVAATALCPGIAIVCCTCCGAAEVSEHAARSILRALPPHTYKLTTLVAEARGLCPQCRNA